MKKFKCTKCKEKFAVSTKAYWKMKEVCQMCFYRLRVKQKSKLFKDRHE